MALPDLTGQNIEDTYQRVLQTDGGVLRDGTGSLVTLTNLTASIISASSYEGFGTDLQIASASNISNLYISEFRETGSSFSDTGQPEIGSILVLDISGSGDGNESVLRRMDFQAFNKAFYASASYEILLDLSASIAEGAAESAYVNGVLYPNGVPYDLDQDGGVGISDLLLFLAGYADYQDAQGNDNTQINKQQLKAVNATTEGEGETQFMSGSFFITTASLSGSLKPSTNILQPGTLRVDSHITSSGNIKAKGLIISGNVNTSGSISADNYKVADGKGITLVNGYSGVTFNDGGNIAIGFGGSWTMDVNKDNGVVLYDFAHLSPSLYKDFRIEGNNDTHLFFVTGGDARIGIGTSTPSSKLDISGDINTTSHITASGNISASGELIGTIDGGTF